MPMGPIELIDEVGLDVAEKVGHILHEGFGERMCPPKTFEKLLEKKRLGKKSGAGFYLYQGGERKEKSFDRGIYDLLGIVPVSSRIGKQEMVERCIFGMVNEAARCLQEGIVSSPEDVDLGMIMGTGFPPFRGGLLRYADSLGLSGIVKSLEEFEKRLGMRFSPSKALRDFAQKGKFHS
jgi:3-hydroxyacyl-CoA dehydrogenase/enoyl-CoA hydratase/3-hydroxybutyryl-CoA epimerase